eukprot:COSAG02_NODE_60731_length_270_cov_0.912281_1_plen_74_part_10
MTDARFSLLLGLLGFIFAGSSAPLQSKLWGWWAEMVPPIQGTAPATALIIWCSSQLAAYARFHTISECLKLSFA